MYFEHIKSLWTYETLILKLFFFSFLILGIRTKKQATKPLPWRVIDVLEYINKIIGCLDGHRTSFLKDNARETLDLNLETVVIVDVWNLHLHGNNRSLHLHINNCTANQELKLLENHWTTVSWAEEWKTCKRIKADRNWPRLGAGQRGSNAFVSIDSQKNLESEFLYWKSTIHTWGEEREWLFMPSGHGTWPSRLCWIWRHVVH